MPSIIFDRFELGIDLRKGESVADANRLRDLKNAYVNSGWSIKKRPGLTKIGELSAGTVGLSAFDGELHTFSSIQSPTHGAIGGLTITNHRLINPDDETLDVQRIYYAKPFNGALYVVAEYTDSSIKHHYLAVDTTWVASTAYSLGDYVSPDAGTGEDGLRYKCTTAGTSGGTEPTWPTALADTVSDGSAVWTAVTTAVDDENCPHSNAVIAVAQKMWAVDGEADSYAAAADFNSRRSPLAHCS